jgi:hypothetical protein
MNKLAKALVIAGVAVLGVVANGRAQVQQPINFNLKLYDQADSGVRIIKITTKDVIENLTGTNVNGAKLWLIMPSDPVPAGDNGNIGASLRVTDAQGNIVVETTSDSFNIYQTVSSQAGTKIYAWNQFSLAFGGLGAELFGTATWTRSNKSPGGQGSFRCTISGTCSLGGTSNGQRPCTGSIIGGATKPAS